MVNAGPVSLALGVIGVHRCVLGRFPGHRRREDTILAVSPVACAVSTSASFALTQATWVVGFS